MDDSRTLNGEKDWIQDPVAAELKRIFLAGAGALAENAYERGSLSVQLSSGQVEVLVRVSRTQLGPGMVRLLCALPTLEISR